MRTTSRQGGVVIDAGRRRRAKAAALVIVSALVVAACGGDDDDATPEATDTTEATDATGAEETADTADAPTTSEASAAPTTEAGAAPTTEASASGTTTAPQPADGEPYKIGVIADLSGPFAGGIGVSGVAGLQGAVEAINAQGGADGHPIELSLHDSLSTSEGAQAAARAAIAEEPNVLYGSYASAQFAAILPILQQAQVPMITLPVQSTLLSPEPPPWLYTAASVQSQIGEEDFKCGELALGGEGSMEGKRVAFVGVVSSNVDRYRNELDRLLDEVGAEMVTEQRRDPTSTTFTSQAQAIVDAEPDIVIGNDNAPGPALVVESLRTAGFEGPICFGQGAGSPEFFESTQDPNVFVIRVMKEITEVPEVADAVRAAGAEPSGAFIMQGWATGWVLKDSFERCGFPCDNDGLIAALDGLTDFSPPGDVTFGPLTFSPTRHTFITTIQTFVWDEAAGTAVPFGDPIDQTEIREPIPD